MRRLPLRACASALGLSLVLLALVPLLGADAQQNGGQGDGPDAASDARQQTWTGTTWLHLQGACPERSECVGSNESEVGTFFLATGGDAGRVVLTWRPVDDSVSVLRVRVAGFEAEGWSPLALDVPGLGAGKHRVEVETVRRVAGLVDQEVAWTASFYVPDPSPSVRVDGASGFSVAAACLAPLGCDPLLDQESSIFLLPWTGHGALEATWPATSPARELRVSIAGTGIAEQGASPLRLDLRALPPGEYRVDVEPVTALAGAEQVVSWMLVAQRVE